MLFREAKQNEILIPKLHELGLLNHYELIQKGPTGNREVIKSWSDLHVIHTVYALFFKMASIGEKMDVFKFGPDSGVSTIQRYFLNQMKFILDDFRYKKKNDDAALYTPVDMYTTILLRKGKPSQGNPPFDCHIISRYALGLPFMLDLSAKGYEPSETAVCQQCTDCKWVHFALDMAPADMFDTPEKRKTYLDPAVLPIAKHGNCDLLKKIVSKGASGAFVHHCSGNTLQEIIKFSAVLPFARSGEYKQHVLAYALSVASSDELNGTDQWGAAALHYAATRLDGDMIQSMLNNKADPLAKIPSNSEVCHHRGSTPLSLACKYKNASAVAVLEKAIAKKIGSRWRAHVDCGNVSVQKIKEELDIE